MPRILLSVMTIALVSGVAFGATRAFFTDEEKNVGNTFSAGTIDIAVDGENPWSRALPYALEDMKPSQTDYIDFVVHNVGTNPVNLLKTLKTFVTADGIQSEPECVEEDGTWSLTPTPACTAQNKPDNNVDKVINYDLTVELYKVDPSTPGAKRLWWETIYTDSDNKKLDSLEGQPLYLGMIPAGWYLRVMQSYHMPTDTGNQYQGDTLTFDIVLDAEQLGVKALRLENKEEVQYGGYSHTILGDSRYADLTYKIKDRKFEYTLSVNGVSDGTYTLIRYDDPLDGTDSWPSPNSLALANVVVSGGIGNVSGSIELNQSLLSSKVWLVKKTYTPGTVTGNLTWDPTNTLFETGLMDYYDADL